MKYVNNHEALLMANTFMFMLYKCLRLFYNLQVTVVVWENIMQHLCKDTLKAFGTLIHCSTLQL